MADFLTTRELAALLRVKERKVYELVAAGSLPVRRVTGKLLFPRDQIEAWLGNETAIAERPQTVLPSLDPPTIMVGGHDPLLDWALRESRSGIASFLDGAMDGLDRAKSGQCIAVGLHIPEGDDWNVETVSKTFGAQPWVLMEWTWRRRGLIYRSDVNVKPTSLREARSLRFQARQPEAASELIFDRLLAQEKLRRDDLMFVDGVERTESDLAMAIDANRADVGVGLEGMARQFNLEFKPLIKERFDLLVWRKAYFDPPFQKFMQFCRTEEFHQKAMVLGGYDASGLGTIRFNGS